MFTRIMNFSVNNRFIVFILVGAACLLGWWSMKHMVLGAIPDLSDAQVIVLSRCDRSPDMVEDQVKYPIVSAMAGASRVKVVRGFFNFGYSHLWPEYRGGPRSNPFGIR